MTALIVARRSPIHGTGVFARRKLAAGTEVIRYRGKLMTHDEADERYGDGGETGHTFLFTLNEHYILDANNRGNDARWINHSCDPNCEAVLYEDPKGDPRKDRVVIEALREIRRGEEITYDYGIVLDVPHTARLKKIWTCLCGSPQCTGTLLKPKGRKPRQASAEEHARTRQPPPDTAGRRRKAAKKAGDPAVAGELPAGTDRKPARKTGRKTANKPAGEAAPDSGPKAAKKTAKKAAKKAARKAASQGDRQTRRAPAAD